MMNWIWFLLIAISLAAAVANGNLSALMPSLVEAVGTAVSTAMGLIGIMSFWLGMMKIAEASGWIQGLARLLRPLSRRLFPDVPADHPAIGAMTLNLAASWLGLGNAATPFGIRAMEHLQELNPDRETASDAMILFLGLNTAAITLAPMTIIGVRASLGSKDPAAVVGPTIFASTIATLTAILAAKWYGRLARSRSRKNLLQIAAQILAAVVLVWGFSTLVLPLLQRLHLRRLLRSGVELLSNGLIPLLILFILLIGMVKKIKVYEVFIDGAKEGFHTAVRIIPFLTAILAAVALFRASGAMQVFVGLLSPVTDALGMPAEVLPAALLRPLSGSGSLGVITELIKTHGADSFIGLLASTLYGCTETTFYV
ncbi:MAG: nucleoside recognition protein, partial [candidate division KSB1 bacterium]|nr:nucleoside recognition protein [candidate division KSB1 bacterium]